MTANRVFLNKHPHQPPPTSTTITASIPRYCYRQAELGVGDCGGLRFIPGVTKSGKQKSPEWLQKALGVEQPEGGATGTGAAGGKTLEELLRLDD